MNEAPRKEKLMRKKRIVSILMMAMLTMTLGTTAFAAEEEGDIAICYQSPTRVGSNFDVGEPVDESLLPKARAATINVNVTSPCDAEFRAKYPSNWAYQANRAIERADDGLYSLYGIDYLSVAQKVWSSSGSDMSTLLDNAKSAHGLTYNGSLKADIMAAFTGKTVDSGVLGVAYTTIPYALIKDGGYNQNAACAQHETSHTYGCSHAGSQWDKDTSCVMYKYLELSNIDKFCTAHNNVMQSNKNRY